MACYCRTTNLLLPFTCIKLQIMFASATVRMYNQLNLGDCFLLHFTAKDHSAYLLVDFGSYQNTDGEREREIAASLKDTVGANPLIIVLTHQHQDHLSGFISAEKILKQLKVSECWLSYLDDPNSDEGKVIRDATEKYWNKNKKNTELVKFHFGDQPQIQKMLKLKKGLDLFGEGQTGGKAISNLLSFSNRNVRFLAPGSWFNLPGLPENTVRVYVLGPPTDKKMLTKLDPGKEEEVNSLDMVSQLMNIDTSSSLLTDALQHLKKGNGQDASARQSDDFPFDKKFTVTGRKNNLQDIYNEQGKEWRQVDHEWLGEMGRLSLQMDTLTNNTSLVLAFELVESGKVLLFAADAQIGSWQSWFNVTFKGTDTKARQLLARTVFYKASHHSSHNATLKEGLDLMKEDELVIMIPVNEEISTSMHFSMLENGMLDGYNRKSHGRVLRSDTIFQNPASVRNNIFPFASSTEPFDKKLNIHNDKLNKSHLFIEYTVE
jgi:hypothetical protein